MLKISFLCISLLYITQILCESYKILVVFPMPGKSHSFLGAAIARHLVDAGHEVTFVTRFPNPNKQHPLLREVDINSMPNFLQGNEDFVNIEKRMEIRKKVDVGGILSLMRLFVETSASLFEHNNVKVLLANPEEQFDVVIAEWMFNELMSGLSAIFKCPLIWVSTVDPHWSVLKLIDEIPNPAYTADSISNTIPPFSFKQRVIELVKTTVGLCLQYFYVAKMEHREYERLIEPLIQKRGHEAPDFEALRYNASLLLGNSHVSMGQSIRLPQNYVAIGGYHIDPNIEPLPEDLNMLLDNSKNGLIYFSMGTNLRSQQLPAAIKDGLLKMFGKLKQTVLWKFEEDLPNRPRNVHIVQWAPQQSILAHPNCVLFITHGGLLSITETIHFGRPIIGIPVFADQFSNVDRAVKRGFAKRVDLSFTMADELGDAIDDIFADSRYTSKAKELSTIYHDRPIPPGKELVHWVEHVVRTRGAPHLRSPALMVPWYQKCYLDLALVTVTTLFVVRLVLKIVRSIFSRKQNKKTH